MLNALYEAFLCPQHGLVALSGAAAFAALRWLYWTAYRIMTRVSARGVCREPHFRGRSL